MILLVLDFVEVSTVAWHDWIKNKLVSFLLVLVGKHVEVSLQVTFPRIGEEGGDSCHRVIDVNTI